MAIKARLAQILRSANDLAAATGAEVGNPNGVATSAAGLVAVIETVGIIAMGRGDTSDAGYRAALEFLASIPAGPSGDKNADFWFETAKRIAHATWLQSQIYRGMIETPEKPFSRLGRTRKDDGFVVDVYDNLPPEEIAKDHEQIAKYATWLLSQLA